RNCFGNFIGFRVAFLWFSASFILRIRSASLCGKQNFSNGNQTKSLENFRVSLPELSRLECHWNLVASLCTGNECQWRMAKFLGFLYSPNPCQCFADGNYLPTVSLGKKTFGLHIWFAFFTCNLDEL